MDPVEESLRAEFLWVKSAQSELSDLRTLTKQFNLFKDERSVALRWQTAYNKEILCS